VVAAWPRSRRKGSMRSGPREQLRPMARGLMWAKVFQRASTFWAEIMVSPPRPTAAEMMTGALEPDSLMATRAAEGDGAEGGVIWIDDIGERDGEGADGSGDVARDAGGICDFVGFLFCEFDGLDVEFPDEVLELGVVEDLAVEEFRVFNAAGFAGVFDEEFGLGEDGAGEGVGFADVGSGFVEAFVNVSDDVGAGEGEDVSVVEEVFFVVFEAVAAGVFFGEFVAPNGGAHGSIKDHDAF